MTHAAIRPEWNPMTIGLMILGFIVFWPLGLAMLAYILWGDRLHEVKSRARCTARKARFSNRNRTGNQAFDDYREAEMNRLEEARRKLEEERDEFEEFVQELRRVKDKEEFDRFMAKRDNAKKAEAADDADIVSEDQPATKKRSPKR